MSTVAFLVETIKPLPRMPMEVYIPIVFTDFAILSLCVSFGCHVLFLWTLF